MDRAIWPEDETTQSNVDQGKAKLRRTSGGWVTWRRSGRPLALVFVFLAALVMAGCDGGAANSSTSTEAGESVGTSELGEDPSDHPPSTGQWRSVSTTEPGAEPSDSGLVAVVSELHEDWPHSGYVAFVREGRVRVYLWPGEETAAREMTDMYGDSVELWLGRQRYPDRYIHEECLGWLTETVEPFVDVEAPALEVELGGRFIGTATLTSQGPDAISFAFLGLEAVVVEPGTTTPLAVVTGPGSPQVGMGTIAGGGAVEAEFVGGTASCRPEIGYTLPPGDYEYRLLVTRPRAPELDDMEPVGFWSQPFPLTVK